MAETSTLLAGIIMGLIIGVALTSFVFPQAASSPSRTITVPGQGSTTVTETVTATDTAEINQLNEEINNLKNQISQLNQQVSSLTPVSIYGTINLTGTWGNSLTTIDFTSKGTTYSVTITNGQFQIYLPHGQVYNVVVHGNGWFWQTWTYAPPQIDLTSYEFQSLHESYSIIK